ncbi:MAG: cytochrome c [Chitinophagales bacterium]|nr:cytochrome c [Chitinophagales bacterium]
MKKVLFVTCSLALSVAMISCGGPRKEPGRAYMPDMAYSRAYETYSSTEALSSKGINYTSTPVEGTVARGEMAAYPFKNDSTGYARSAEVKNPLDSASRDMKEAERLYLINCGICHGTKLDGNGPLYASGVFPAAPRNLVGDPLMIAMTEGTMFHSLTYGKNTMGSYASQLSTKQRWMITAYVKEQQAKKTGTAAPAATAAAAPAPAAKDSAVAAPKK